jgi:hypothetical protein
MLAAVRPDGRPDVRPILGLWLDDAFYCNARVQGQVMSIV